MFKHILVPVDGSSTALMAAQRAAQLAKAFGSRVTLMFVIDPYPFVSLGGDFAFGQVEYLSAAKAEANLAIRTAKAKLEAVGVPAESCIEEATAVWRGVVQAAQDEQVDLIVIGSHGRSGLERLVLGSVTQAVLAHTQVAVLVVRDDKH